MKGLTLRHPWPFAICYWGKGIENRGWQPRTELKIGQRFAIHGGRRPDNRAYWRYVRETTRDLVDRFGWPPNIAPDISFEALVDRVITPGIVCTAVLSDILAESEDPWFEGPLGWQMTDVQVLAEPIRCPGAQGLWTIPKDIEERLVA